MPNQDGAIIDTMLGAMASGDHDTAFACLTPDARVWHNFDGIAQSRDEALVGWQALTASFPECAIADVRRHAIPGGFVQQHMIVCGTAAGLTKAWPVCLMVRIENGLIARIDEYIDRAGAFDAEHIHMAATPGR